MAQHQANIDQRMATFLTDQDAWTIRRHGEVDGAVGIVTEHDGVIEHHVVAVITRHRDDVLIGKLKGRDQICVVQGLHITRH